MRKISSVAWLLSLGLIAGALVGCKKKNNTVTKDPLVIPTVDVESLNINLPTLPTRNQGAIRSDADYEYIDLYQLSDFHGAVNYEVHSEGHYIGLPKLATYLDGKRANNPGGTLVLSSGDMFQGSADSNLTRGYMVNYAMHYMGFDAMGIGNHEFDWGLDWLKKNAELTYSDHTIPYVAANIQKDGEILSFLHKSTVVTRGAYKIGLIGVIGSELESSVLKTALDGCEFTPYNEILTSETARLRTEEGCQAVVLLAHESADNIESTYGVDAIFGGHAHQDKIATYAGTPCVATLNYGQSVGHISLKFDKSSKSFIGVEDAEIEAMSSVAAGLSDNADIVNIMDQYAPAINEIKHIKLGTADAKLAFDGALINICVDGMYEAAVKSVKANYTTIDPNKIVAAFHNVNGGIRSDIEAGDITYGDVYKSFPFDNEVVLIKISGTEARTKLTKLKSLGCYRVFEDKNYFDASQDYYLVTTDFLAFSEQGFATFRGEPLTDDDIIRTGSVVRDEVANKIYQIDSLKNADLLHTGDYHYKKIPMVF